MNNKRSNIAQPNRVHRTTRISYEVDNIIRDYAASTGKPINKALEDIVTQWQEQTSKEANNDQSLQDRMITLEKQIKSLYAYVGTVRDDVVDLRRHTGMS